MNQSTNDAAADAAANTPDPAAAAAGAAVPPAGGAFAEAAAAGDPAAALPVPLSERIPEKLRVVKEDGSVDIEASAAKLVEGYTNLEKRLGTGDAPPKTPEDYAPELPDAINIDELKADPLYQSFLKGAHGKGLTNAQVSWVLNEYASRAADQAAPAPMTNEEFRTAVEPHFTALGGYNKGIELGLRTIKTFVPDVTQEDLASIPNHPLIARILAAVGKEVGEDAPIIAGDTISPSDFDSEAAAIKASEAYNKASHPEHKAAVEKLTALYERRYGKQPQKLGASAIVKTG